MTGPLEDTRFDLTGDWIGSYSYEGPRPPVLFQATFHDADGWLSGATAEPGGVRVGGRTLAATLQGRREARSVRFLKTYDADLPGYDAVRYEGELSPDATEIDGRWVIREGIAGEFVMVRKGHPYAVAALSAADKVDVR